MADADSGSGLARLRTGIAGSVVAPGDDGYSAATATWDLSAHYSPPVVVNAAVVDDIASAARWARDNGLGIGMLATGHGAFGDMADCVLINVAALTEVRLDGRRRRATVGPGARWSDVQSLTTPHGLIGLLGGSATVGVTGYTLGGGLSPLSRAFGFAADRVTRVTVLDSDLRPTVVDAEHEPEVFWALRGGGGLGIVTGLEFEVVAVPRLFGGGVYFAGEDAVRVLTAYRDWLPTLDERTCTSVALVHLPPVPSLPEPIRGRFVAHLRVAHVDGADTDLEATGRALIAPMLAAANVIDDYTRVMTPDEIPDIHRDPVAPTDATYRGGHLDGLDDAVIGTIAAAAGAAQRPQLIEVRHLGGAIQRGGTGNAATARDSAFNLYVTARPDADDPTAPRRLVDGIVERIGSPGIGAHLSFYGPAPEPGHILRLWDETDAERLLAVRDHLDPQGLLRDGRPLR